MALTSYIKFRFLWGALDWQNGTDHPYAPADTANLGASAAPGAGIGVRRVVTTFDRATAHPGADPCQAHFDFLNFTGGVPDDTWTSGDYSSLETMLDTLWTARRGDWPAGYRVTQYAWYRHGPGIVAPNPAERTTVKGTPIVGTGANHNLPPQVACSVTFRTSVRRSWGRTYFPWVAPNCESDGTISSAQADAVATSVGTLVTSAAAADFALVVVSNALSAALNVEHVEVDDNLDIIRRRRWKASVYKKIVP